MVGKMSKIDKSVQMFHILSCYTLSLKDPLFIHQHVVDAFAAQSADESTKNITVSFALIGLYLHIERNFSGKEVQNAHIKLGRRKKNWPKFVLPDERGNITVHDVLAVPEGPKRDLAIEDWCASVWQAYSHCHNWVTKLVRMELWGNK